MTKIKWERSKRKQKIADMLVKSPIYPTLTQGQLYQELTGEELPVAPTIPNPSQHDYPNMRTNVITITPEMAMRWLEGRTHNRAVNQVSVLRFAEDMHAGAWKLNGESLIFDVDGCLIDGQHRLWACVESGAPFTTVVVTGVPTDSFYSIDQGRARSLNDHVVSSQVLSDVKYSQYVTAAATLIWRYRNNQLGVGGRTPYRDVVALVQSEPELQEWATKVRSKAARGISGLSSTVMAVLHIGAAGYREEAEKFAEQWSTGIGLVDDSPILALRNRALNSKMPRDPFDRMAMVTSAWNNFVRRRPMVRIISPRGDEFPTILGSVKSK